MLLMDYTFKVMLPECNHSVQTVNAIAELSDDISEVLPYLNATIKGCNYLSEAGILRFVREGRAITLYPKQIAVTRLEGEVQAKQVLESIRELINSTYERRGELKPSYRSGDKLKFLEVYKLLPGTNCKQCSEPTCLAFANKLARREKKITDCVLLYLEEYRQKREKLLALLESAGYV